MNEYVVKQNPGCASYVGALMMFALGCLMIGYVNKGALLLLFALIFFGMAYMMIMPVINQNKPVLVVTPDVIKYRRPMLSSYSEYQLADILKFSFTLVNHTSFGISTNKSLNIEVNFNNGKKKILVVANPTQDPQEIANVLVNALAQYKSIHGYFK